MKCIATTTIEIEEDNGLIEIQVEGYVIYSIEKSYGEDADGNRGTSKTIVDDVVELTAYYNSDVIDLTDPQKQQAEDAIVKSFLGE